MTVLEISATVLQMCVLNEDDVLQRAANLLAVVVSPCGAPVVNCKEPN